MAIRRSLAFDFEPGTRLADKYEVIEALGSGWEGEVYKVMELRTGIVRAAKLFYPKRNPRNRTLRFYARKLHKLRDCPILIHYHAVEPLDGGNEHVAMMLSDFVDGELLPTFLKRFPGNRLTPFAGLHLLHALVAGVEPIHEAGEYHGDLHSENVIVVRFGLMFELRLIDLYRGGDSLSQNRQADVCDLVYLMWESLGGSRTYRRHPDVIKYICCGLKRTLILRKFPTVTHLRRHLERLSW